VPVSNKLYLRAFDHVTDVKQLVGEETRSQRFGGMAKRLATADALAAPRN
jgi:type I restriction enzyme R subunit